MRRVVHFDVKSANILLGRDWTAKIADVGLAKILKDGMLSTLREVRAHTGLCRLLARPAAAPSLTVHTSDAPAHVMSCCQPAVSAPR